MAYESKQRKIYNQSFDTINQTISQLTADLGGVSTAKQALAPGQFDINFKKKINGEFISNRIQVKIKVTAQSDTTSQVAALAFPVDPVGQKLEFGVIGQPSKFVLDTFFGELDKKI